MALNFFGISIPTPSLPSFSRGGGGGSGGRGRGGGGGGGFSLPKFSAPKLPSLPKFSVPKISVPKIEVPKFSVPKISVPKIEVPKISLPKISVPKIEVPKISLPKISVPKVEVPKISLPKISVPKVELPKVELPKLPGTGAIHPIVSLPAAAAAGAADAVREKLPKVDLPKVKLPDVGKTAGAVSRGYDDVIRARDQSYEAGIEHIAAGDVGRGGLQFGSTMAADVLLPMDLGDAVNKWMSGRGDEIDPELALWAAIDAVSLAAAPLTFGASYAAGRALKAGKLAKAAKIAESTKVGGEVAKGSAFGKLGRLLTGVTKTAPKTAPKVTSSSYLKAFEQAAKTAKQRQAAAKTAKQRQAAAKTAKQRQAAAKAAQRTAYSRQFAKFQQQQADFAAKLRKQQQEIASQIAKQQAKLADQMSRLAAKFKAPTKGLGTAADLAKAESRWAKTSSVLGKGAKATGLVGIGLGAGAIGLTMMGGAGGPAPAPGPEEEEEELPQWLIDLLSGGAGAGGSPWIDDGVPPPGLDFPYGDFIYPDGLGGYTDAYGNYPAAYPDLLGLEGYGQDMCGSLEELPGIGGVYEEARRRGLGIPAIVGTIVLIVLVVAFLRSKKGKKMVRDAKKKVTG